MPGEWALSPHLFSSTHPHVARMITPLDRGETAAARAPIPCTGRHDGWRVSLRVHGENDNWVAKRCDLGTCPSQALLLTVWPRDPQPRHRLGSV